MVSGKRLSFNHLKYFMLPKNVCILLKKQKLVVLCFLMLPYFFFFTTMSYMNMNSDDILGFIGPQLIKNAEALLCIYTTHMAKMYAHVININL